MTPEQFRRWKDFALRMARTCFEGQLEPDPAWIIEAVEDFFWRIDEADIVTFESWDHSGEYPRETGYFETPWRPCRCCWIYPEGWPCARHDATEAARGAARQAGLCGETLEGEWRDSAAAYLRWRAGWPGGCEGPAANFFRPGIVEACTCNPVRHRSPGPPDPGCETCGGDPDYRRMATGPYVCDLMSEIEADAYPRGNVECGHCRTPNRWEARRTAERAGLDDAAAESYARWRSTAARWDRCTCDEDDQARYEAWVDRWYGPVSCCVRAGIDFAADPSAGVIGFTAGDVRRMYPEGVPDWVFPPNERLHHWPTDRVNGTFPELPDEAQVVL